MSVLLQVDLSDFIRALAGNHSDKGLDDALKEAAIAQQSIAGRFHQPLCSILEKNIGRQTAEFHFQTE